MIQSEKGNDIAVLRVAADTLRRKRRQTQRKRKQAPLKMTFPLRCSFCRPSSSRRPGAGAGHGVREDRHSVGAIRGVRRHGKERATQEAMRDSSWWAKGGLRNRRACGGVRHPVRGADGCGGDFDDFARI
jgi:hypothetical protein